MCLSVCLHVRHVLFVEEMNIDRRYYRITTRFNGMMQTDIIAGHRSLQHDRQLLLA